MLFVSFDFLLFIIPVLLLAWALANVSALRVLFLIAASYFFYMAGPHTDPIQPPWYFAGLLFLSTVLDFVCSHRIAARRPAQEAGDPGARNFDLPFAAYGRKWADVLESLPEASAFHAWPLWGLLMLVALTVQFLYLVLRPKWNQAWWRIGLTFAVLMPAGRWPTSR